MRQYIGPFIVALILNALILFFVLHIHVHYQGDDVLPASVAKSHSTHPKLSGRLPPHASKVSAAHWLQKHFGKAISITKRFKAGENLQGLVVTMKSNPAQHAIMYSLNNGEYFVVGTIFDKQGKNISLKNSHQYIKSDKDKDIFNEAQSMPGIVQGDKSVPQAIIIIDPNSNRFPQQWDEVAYDVAHGLFAVKWVLVNYLKPMGPNVAGNILQAKHKLAAMNYNAIHYNKETLTGGYSHKRLLSQVSKQTLINNWDFVQKYGLYQLPVTILKSNNKYYVIKGVVMDETFEALFSSDVTIKK